MLELGPMLLLPQMLELELEQELNQLLQPKQYHVDPFLGITQDMVILDIQMLQQVNIVVVLENMDHMVVPESQKLKKVVVEVKKAEKKVEVEIKKADKNQVKNRKQQLFMLLL